MLPKSVTQNGSATNAGGRVSLLETKHGITGGEAIEAITQLIGKKKGRERSYMPIARGTREPGKKNCRVLPDFRHCSSVRKRETGGFTPKPCRMVGGGRGNIQRKERLGKKMEKWGVQAHEGTGKYFWREGGGKGSPRERQRKVVRLGRSFLAG